MKGRKAALTPEEAESIRKLYGTRNYAGRLISMNILAVNHHVSPGTIAQVLNRKGPYAKGKQTMQVLTDAERLERAQATIDKLIKHQRIIEEQLKAASGAREFWYNLCCRIHLLLKLGDWDSDTPTVIAELLTLNGFQPTDSNGLKSPKK